MKNLLYLVKLELENVFLTVIQRNKAKLEKISIFVDFKIQVQIGFKIQLLV